MFLCRALAGSHRQRTSLRPSDIGLHFTTKAWYLVTHRMDEQVDLDRAYLLQDLFITGYVDRFGYVRGVGVHAWIYFPEGVFPLLLHDNPHFVKYATQEYSSWSAPTLYRPFV